MLCNLWFWDCPSDHLDQNLAGFSGYWIFISIFVVWDLGHNSSRLVFTVWCLQNFTAPLWHLAQNAIFTDTLHSFILKQRGHLSATQCLMNIPFASFFLFWCKKNGYCILPIWSWAGNCGHSVPISGIMTQGWFTQPTLLYSLMTQATEAVAGLIYLKVKTALCMSA